jgi:transcriptional regulator with XRE-family HTH domain
MSPIRLRVAELRQAKGWTQKELADRAGISRQTVIRVENDTNRRLDYDVLEKLAEAFAVDPAYLIVSESRKRGRGSA